MKNLIESTEMRPGGWDAMLDAQEVGQLNRQLAAAQARIQELRGALKYHQMQTRPIYTTMVALERTDDLSALNELKAGYEARIEELREALDELVACKNLADKFDALKENVHDFATAAVVDGIHAEYLRRKPAAWQAAREATARTDDLSALESIKRQARREALLEALAALDDGTNWREPYRVAVQLRLMAEEVKS